MSIVRDRAMAADRSRITIDGRDLRDFGVIVTGDGWTIGSAKTSVSSVDVPGVPGGIDTSLEMLTGNAYPGRRQVSVGVACVGDEMEIREGMSMLGALVGRTVRLGGIDPRGVFRGRLNLDDWDVLHSGGRLRAAKTTIQLDAEPWLLGSKIVDSWDTMYVRKVTGTMPAPPIFRFSPPKTGGEILVENSYVTPAEVGDVARVRFTVPANRGDGVTVDCEAHTVMVGATLLAPSLDTEWISLLPGFLNRLSVTGETQTIPFTVEYSPRWMI